jgi:hypothetical protein
MGKITEKQAERILALIPIIFFASTWIMLCIATYNLAMRDIFEGGFGPVDVAKRVTSPDGSKTAILVRSYVTLDLNFILYVTDDHYVDIDRPNKTALFYFPDGQWVSFPTNKRGWL